MIVIPPTKKYDFLEPTTWEYLYEKAYLGETSSCLVYVEKRERDFQFKGVTLGKIQKKICHWL
jgi:hypothetical protein